MAMISRSEYEKAETARSQRVFHPERYASQREIKLLYKLFAGLSK
jgi:hypothetical protein